ncbi:MAG: SDR family NAD(P)-dependent oxidoreductase [Planctomycetota bacterium]|jgi:NAD(P)-dependent dehydrogenase (short-subunit alcohol dehydrogenase family)
MSDGVLKDRAILVTGGGRNIGRAISVACGKAGASVAVLEIEAGGAAETLESLEAVGARGVEVVADLKDPAAVEAAFDAAVEALGPLTGLVNNAAVYVRKDFLELTEEDWDLTLDTNLKSAFLATQSFARRASDGGGAVVHIASVHGSMGDGTVVSHCAAKAGLLGLMRSSADALRDRNIRVNAVSPGAVATWKGPWDSPVPEKPLEDFLVPSMVADSVVWLLSDGSAGITGVDMVLGGGTAPTLRLPGD